LGKNNRIKKGKYLDPCKIDLKFKQQNTCSAMLAASAYASWIFSASLWRNIFDIPPAATMKGPVANVNKAICQQLIRPMTRPLKNVAIL
jgi:hypothetical protein